MVCIDRNSEITGYVLRYGEASIDQREEEVIAGSGDEGGMYVIVTLSPLTSYYIEVAAASDSGIGPFTNITVQTPLYGKSSHSPVCRALSSFMQTSTLIPLSTPFTQSCTAPDNPLAVEEGVTSTAISITWEGQEFVDSHRISFERVTGGQQVLCPDVSHTGMEAVGGSSTEYTVRGLQVYSTYSITVTAVNAAGDTPSTITAITLQAGMEHCTVTGQTVIGLLSLNLNSIIASE